MSLEPLAVGVCSWSLQVGSVPELSSLLKKLGVDVVQIACGDPHHAAWAEGDAMPAAANAAGFRMTGAMLGFPGEDYTTPQTIQHSGGFGNPATRKERLERLAWALDRTKALGLTDTCSTPASSRSQATPIGRRSSIRSARSARWPPRRAS